MIQYVETVRSDKYLVLTKLFLIVEHVGIVATVFDLDPGDNWFES
jgi:hypothetical protein